MGRVRLWQGAQGTFRPPKAECALFKKNSKHGLMLCPPFIRALFNICCAVIGSPNYEVTLKIQTPRNPEPF